MKKVTSFFAHYSVWIVVGAILQVVAVRMAYLERGYKTLGGEWMVFPMVLIAAWFVRTIVAGMKNDKERRK